MLGLGLGLGLVLGSRLGLVSIVQGILKSKSQSETTVFRELELGSGFQSIGECIFLI